MMHDAAAHRSAVKSPVSMEKNICNMEEGPIAGHGGSFESKRSRLRSQIRRRIILNTRTGVTLLCRSSMEGCYDLVNGNNLLSNLGTEMLS